MLTYTKIKEAQVISQVFSGGRKENTMIKRKCAKAILFIAIFTIALAGQVVQKEKVQQRNLEYEKLQERARQMQMTSGIREQIIDGFVDQDWEGLMERSIDKTVKESAEVMSYVEGISEQAERGRDKALAKEEN